MGNPIVFNGLHACDAQSEEITVEQSATGDSVRINSYRWEKKGTADSKVTDMNMVWLTPEDAIAFATEVLSLARNAMIARTVLSEVTA